MSIAPLVRIAFDRGTLRIEGERALGRVLPGVVWDTRTDCLRAAAHRYADVLERVAELQLDCDDRIAPLLAERVTVHAPPLRTYQVDALAAWRANGCRGVVVLPTGAGKTRVAVAALALSAVRGVVLCPTCALLEHWERELARWYPGPVGIVGDGIRRIEDLTVMTFESGFRRLDELADRFGLVVVDEVHHFATGQRAEALEMCPAPRRLGLTATAPDAGTAASDRLTDLVGPVVCELGLADLVGKHLAPVTIERIRVQLTAAERDRYAADYRPYATLHAALRRADPEADPVAIARVMGRTREGRAALAGRERAFALASFPAAKRRLAASLLERHRADRTLVFTALAADAYEVSRALLVPAITADIGRAERHEILERFRDGAYRAIVSARVLNEGIDVPDANVAVVLGGRLGLREHIQRVGRVLRPAPGKRALVYDVITSGTVEDRHAERRRGFALAG